MYQILKIKKTYLERRGNVLRVVGKLEEIKRGEEDGSEVNIVFIYKIQKVNLKALYIMLVFKELTWWLNK